MKAYYTENIQFYIILFVWLVTGMYGGPIIYIVLPATLLLMKRQGMYEEMLLGFFFILILSDSYELRLFFAKSAKNIYITLLAVFFLFDSKEFQPLNSLYKLFFPFFLISVYCLCFTETFGISVQKTLSYYLMILVIPNYFAKIYRDNGEAFFRNLVYFVVTILLISALLIVVSHNVAYSSGRYRGMLGNPNGLGLFCFLVFLLFSVIKNVKPNLFDQRQVAFIYVVIVASMLLTGSRNSIVGVFVFVLFQRFYKINLFFGFLMAILFVFGVELVSSNLASIVTTLGLGDFLRVKTLDDGSGRYVAWGFAWKHVQENFFIGRGFGYDEHYMRSNWDLLSKMGHQGGIHNTFLTFWMDMGLVGLLIYLRSLILAFAKAAKNTTLAYPIMFVIMFTAFFESWLVGSLNPHTIIFLMILALISDPEFYVKKEEELSLAIE
ncbi:MAG: hypothetical protein JWP12_222 [Bacteroidetes bacterium]|nr:hypothetical protein [Bacteroidota bacterium]